MPKHQGRQDKALKLQMDLVSLDTQGSETKGLETRELVSHKAKQEWQMKVADWIHRQAQKASQGRQIVQANQTLKASQEKPKSRSRKSCMVAESPSYFLVSQNWTDRKIESQSCFPEKATQEKRLCCWIEADQIDHWAGSQIG